jgi:tripartite-type tricarboxylate transporter receptor subunit TctC
MAGRAATPVRSDAHLVALAQSQPHSLKFASGGNGTPAHLGAEMLKRQAGVSLVHIPYKGAPAAVAALVAGDVDLMIGSTGPVSAQVKSGRLRVLATPAPQRIAAYPELPTMIELGYAGFELRDWQGIVAPAGTPREVIDRLHAEIAKVLALREVRERLESVGMVPAGAGPDEFQAHIRSELQKWAKVVREAGITAD